MTYDEALRRVGSLLRFGIKPGLERVGALLERVGRPQDGLPAVHVAGTNGKGSTSALISSVLSHAGYCTGLFTSPYVSDFRERFQIDGEMIAREELAALVEELWPAAGEVAAQAGEITEFEFITALALLWFARRRCDIVVLEVGLGGRFDSTNIIPTPVASVVCPISLDHTAILGDTIEKIAMEKCGIIKPGGVTVTCPGQRPEALAVIQRTARERGSRLIEADAAPFTVVGASLEGTQLIWRHLSLHLPFLGAHQLQNAATALAALSVAEEKGFHIAEEAYSAGFTAARIPARLELLSRDPVVLLDGAHNPDGAAALASALKRYLGGRRVVALMGMLADKDVDTALQALGGIFSHVVTLAPRNPRAMKAEELAGLWRERDTPAAAAQTVPDALRMLFRLADGDPAVICGSLYLAGDVRDAALQMLKNSPGTARTRREAGGVPRR